MELSLATTVVGDRTVLAVGGEIDVYTAPKLRESMIELIDDGTTDLVVDMAGVEFLDSTGLGVLVGGLKRLRTAGGSFALACDQPRILKIFRITGLERVFAIYPTVQDAVVGGRTASGTDAAGSDTAAHRAAEGDDAGQRTVVGPEDAGAGRHAAGPGGDSVSGYGAAGS